MVLFKKLLSCQKKCKNVKSFKKNWFIIRRINGVFGNDAFLAAAYLTCYNASG